MTAPLNPATAFARVLVDELVRDGVTDAVVCPGSRSAPVALALHQAELAGRLRLHVRIDERTGAFLALGLAKASGRPVPVLTTSGTATAHLHAAVLEADQSGIPLLLLTADRPPELRGTGANQTIDQVGLYGGAVRWAADLGVPEEGREAPQNRYWRSVAARAVLVAIGALSGDPGPVHLNLALREPLLPEGTTPARPCRRGSGPAAPTTPRGPTPPRAAARARWWSAPPHRPPARPAGPGAPWWSPATPPSPWAAAPRWSPRSAAGPCWASPAAAPGAAPARCAARCCCSARRPGPRRTGPTGWSSSAGPRSAARSRRCWPTPTSSSTPCPRTPAGPTPAAAPGGWAACCPTPARCWASWTSPGTWPPTAGRRSGRRPPSGWAPSSTS
ncbi:thiamine pyrophosphate-binding protein [Klenkia terrae]|uniref:thiamine pyrophosphate-binding protein n=1 Tax=Klenkia terrae TaxID=1052259 RepID=UPI00360691C9